MTHDESQAFGLTWERFYLALENAATLADIDEVAWAHEVNPELTRFERNALRAVWHLRREEIAAELMRAGRGVASFAMAVVS